MAQPSTSSPSRPQLLALDTSPVKTHSLLDQEQGQQQKEEGQYQQHSLLQVPLQQQPQQSFPPAPSQHRPPHQPPHATQRDLSNTSTVPKSHTHSSSLGPGHVSNGGDGDATIAGATTATAAAAAGAAAVVAAPSTNTNGGSTVYPPPNYQPATTTTSSAGPPVNGCSENGQNGMRYNGDTPLSTSPLMSNSQPPPGHPRQPVSYPNPTSYPPSGMPSAAQYAFPPQVGAPPEPYRPTPTALPSMRTLDHVQSHQQLSQHQHQQQHQHQHQHQHPQQHPQQHQHQQHQHQLQLQHQHQHQHHNTIPLASHIGAPMAAGPAMGYYNVPTHPYGMHTDPTGAMRFSIAPGMPPDPRIAMSGGRHKKEIKRRTKTGCLTCRKRRIKCDETHPTCNNCKKSKRECLGYDPIFKQQQGPAAIQPAPNSGQQPQPSVPQTLASTPTVPSSATQHPPYQPPVVPSSYPASLPSNIAFDSPVASTPQSAKTDAGFDYSTAIDPALQGADTSSATGTPSPQYSNIKAEAPDKFDGGQGQQLRGGTPFIFTPPLLIPQPREIKLTYQSCPAKKMKVDELITLGGAAPSTPTSPPSATLVDEITKLYYEIYVPGLTLFFESRWYTHSKDQPQWPSPSPTSGPNSLLLLHQNKAVLNLFTSFLQNIIDIKSTDPADMIRSGHLETHVVWALARLPLSSLPRDVPPRSNIPPEDDLLETTNRLHVFETLLSGDVLETNPLWSPNQVVAHGDSDRNISLRKNEFEFWHHLGQFLLKSHSSMSADGCSARERYLGQMRSLLNGRENRDVLYSIAVLREYTMHWDAILNEQTISSQLDESEPRSKLAVATRFIRNEASTEATTNVVRQFANLAYRAFVRPGVNAKSGGKKA